MMNVVISFQTSLLRNLTCGKGNSTKLSSRNKKKYCKLKFAKYVKLTFFRLDIAADVTEKVCITKIRATPITRKSASQ